jgi:hypothetical protein
MTYYTFRLIHSSGAIKVFECCKWGEEKEPLDVYTIRAKTKSRDCNCWSHGTCKHIELVNEIIDNSLENEMHQYIWDYDNTWQFIEDMVE